MMPLAPQMTTLDAAIIIVLAAVCFILFLMSLYLFKEVQFLKLCSKCGKALEDPKVQETLHRG